MIVAIVPIKRLDDAKSRLASILGPAERQGLVRAMLGRTIEALRRSGLIGSIALATPDQELAAEFSCVHVPDRGDLNRSLLEGIAWAKGMVAQGALLIPADLPAVQAGDIRTVVRSLGGSEGVCVVGTRDGGTGALLLVPPDAMSPQFGPESYRNHVSGGVKLGLRVVELEVEGLSHDLDTVEDLDALAAPLDV